MSSQCFSTIPVHQYRYGHTLYIADIIYNSYIPQRVGMKGGTDMSSVRIHIGCFHNEQTILYSPLFLFEMAK